MMGLTRVRLDVIENILTEGVVKLWKRLPREVVENVQKCVGVAPGDMV